MVRQALMISSKPLFESLRHKSSKSFIRQQPSRLTGAKSILCCSLNKALLIHRKEVAVVLSDRLSQKNGVTHASAPPRSIIKLHH